MTPSAKPKLDTSYLSTKFIEWGLQYFVAGRFAIMNLLPPVNCILMHHAIEMIMKAALVSTVPPEELKAKYKHNLNRLWKATKAKFPAENLKQFDDVVSKLHRFERLRYPDKLISEGATMQIAIERNYGFGKVSPAPNQATSYKLALENIDQLFKVLFLLADGNPPAYFNCLKDSAIAVVNERNLHPMYKR